jgi:hypothetical protein
MSRLLLGAGFACLVATSASATGFHIPPLPDFELLREAGEIAAARAETPTGVVKTVHTSRQTAISAHGKHGLPASNAE